MAFADKQGIDIISPFKFHAESLLDIRQQVETTAERNELVTIKAATAGLRVYVKATKKSYVYNGTSWDELTTGSASLVVTLNGGTSEGTNKFTYNTRTAKTINITPSSIGAAAASHTHTKSQITDFPTSLKNPSALKFTGASTSTYDGSAAVTVNIPTSSATPSSLVVTLNGGTTEGTDKFTFNGSTAKTINITPSTIGAAEDTHTHGASDINGLTANRALISDASGKLSYSAVTSTELGYLDGVTSNVQTQLNGKAAASHTHNYAGSGSAGGAANSAVKLTTARTINGVSFNGTANINIPNNYFKQMTDEDLDDCVGSSFYGEYYAGGGNTVTNKPSGVDAFYLKIFRNASGYTAQSLNSLGIWYTRYYNGTSWIAWATEYSTLKKPTPAEIGAAAASHGTHVSFSTTVPKANGTAAVGTASTVSRSDHVHPLQTTVSGNAGSATKLATARTIDGVSFNGTANITHYGTCSTAAATAAKTVTCTGFTLATGAKVIVKFTVTNTAASPTLNVNSTGAKAIYYKGAAISAGYLAANKVYSFIYDGTNYVLIGDVDTNTNTTYSTGTASTAGLTKLYTGTGTATDGTMTQNAITTALNGKAASSHTHTKSQITDFPSSLKNPNAIKFTGAVTATYDGSAAVTVDIPTSGATTAASLIVKLNGGTVEGTSMFTFNGGNSKTINITPSSIGAAAASHGTHVSFSTTVPKANGTAAVGTATTVSRSDHVHPLQTTVSGNAGSATKLATARTIDGVSFNGSANIIHYGPCRTAAATAAKTVACTGFTLEYGAMISVKFTVSNTAANPTLNVNSTGAKPIFYKGAAIAASYLKANRIYTFVFEGTNFVLVGDVDTNTTYSTGTASAAGLTKLYTGTGTATDGTMTQNAITTALSGKAASSHTHNYAGSSSAGGAANSAVKLTTARTINDASFDGTKNITLTTMGAEDITGDTLNLNTLNLSSGSPLIKYYVEKTSGGAANITNAAVSGQPFTLICKVIRYNNTTDYITKQIFESATTKKTYTRFCVRGTWSAWVNETDALTAHKHDASDITSGVLPIARGGTGGVSAQAANYNILNSAVTGTSGWSDNTMLAYFTGNPSASAGAVFRYKSLDFWEDWLNGKIAASYAAKSHTHTATQVTGLTASRALVSNASGQVAVSAVTSTELGYLDGVTSNIQTQLNGKAATSHTHNYAGSSSAGGAATSAVKVPVPVGTVLFATSSSTTFFNACFGGTWTIVGNIDAIIDDGTSTTLYMFKKTAA